MIFGESFEQNLPEKSHWNIYSTPGADAEVYFDPTIPFHGLSSLKARI